MRHPPMDSSLRTSRISTFWLLTLPSGSLSIATKSGRSPGLASSSRTALAVVEEKLRKGETSSEPGVNKVAVSNTRTGPWIRPTTSRVSWHANVMVFGIAGASNTVRLGVNAVSVVSSVAELNASRKSASGDSMIADQERSSNISLYVGSNLSYRYHYFEPESPRQTTLSRSQ